MMENSDIGGFLNFLADAILIVDSDSKIRYANKACLKLFGYEREGMLNLKLDTLIGERVDGHAKKVAGYIESQGEARSMMSRTVINCKDAKGRTFQARISLATFRYKDEPCGIATIQDYTQVNKAIEHLTTKALTDPLTGLGNKRHLYSKLHSQQYFMDPNSDYLYAFIDLNGFKEVNDTYGHSKGDELIRSVAARLYSQIRSDDLLVRMGGDEFLAIFKVAKADAHDVIKNTIAIKIQNEIKACFNEIGAVSLRKYYAGIGLVVGTSKDEPLSIIKEADIAMYHSKASGTLYEGN